MKGIILAGGSGSRLHPITRGVSKQLMPIYDKPMIYYPLSTLMLAGIQEILIITTPEDIHQFERLLGNGSELGLSLSYITQPSPDGLAQAFILGENFIGNDDVCLVLGDNVFHGNALQKLLESAKLTVTNQKKASVCGYYVSEPERYGVAEFDHNGTVLNITEKPVNPKSNFAVVGLYFYPNDVIQIAKAIKPSERGELEITSINQEYLSQGRLKVEQMGRGYAWLDTGTHDSLLAASEYIAVIERRQGLKVACLEEIAYELGYITSDELLALAKKLKKTGYGSYLLKRHNDLTGANSELHQN